MASGNKFLVGGLVLVVAAYIGITNFRTTGLVVTQTNAEPQTVELSFDAFQDKVFWDAVKKSPETMSRLRVFEAQGITKHNALLDDLSVARSREDLADAETTLARLLSYDDGGLSAEQQLNKELMAYSLREQVRNGRFLFHNYPMTQLYGWHNGLAGFLTGTHSVADAQEARYYLARLNAVRAQFTQLMGQLRDREELGIIPPTFIIDKTLVQLDIFVKSDPKQNAFYVAFEAKLNAVEAISQDEKIGFLVAAERAIYTEIYPVWGELQSYLGKLKAKSTNDAGVWKLPDGKAYYQAQLELFTTTKMTADEIHSLGLSEVARIQSQMLALFEAEGYDTSGDFVTLINGFAKEDRHFYPDTDEGRAQIIADYTAMIEEIAAGISSQFNLTPKALVEVARVPVFLEQGAPGGYYEDPAVDGSRPGRFYANLYDIKATPKYGMRALTYHEAVPGHHYQIALQQETKSLPWFRKYAGYTAYVEGWALYAERVALEMGFQPTNLDKIGALQSEMFRAVRLVVDTGIHDKRWTREQAIKYMADNTGMAISDVTSEIERYIVWPGQATGYKIGQLTLLRLRDEAREALGDKFDIRAFHDLVLTGGAVPLTVLEGLVKNYIASQKE
ncbi:MAG: DUF885 domain-containing protein [Kordiimonadaceae bacterium]|nr:DUF885 domain-containing protein [Kordiimonadaceae bacterium]